MSKPLAEIQVTDRGFEIGYFSDANGSECVVQQSSAIGNHYDAYDRPGSLFVWLGVKGSAMHLDRDQVKALIDVLQTWSDTGSLTRDN